MRSSRTALGTYVAVLAAAVVGLGLIGAPAHARPVAATSAADERIARQLLNRVDAPALGGNVAVHVRDTGQGRTVFAERSTRPMLPASTMKVITAATSVQLLGAAHRFTTQAVLLDDGSLALVGGGDPLLTQEDLGLLATRTAKGLRKAGVARVRVHLDDYLFPAPRNAVGWVGDDMPVYASAVRPLGLLGSYSRDTAVIAQSVFVSALRSRGINASAAGRRDAPESARVVARFRGNDLGDAVELMLRVSENNIAEVLFRHVALASGRPASWAGAAAATRDVLAEWGISTDRHVFADGSGLSQADRVTARTLTALLDIALADPRLDVVLDGLPVAGQTGTLTYRFAAPPASCARGAVQAKTGSLTGVSTLAGITRGRDGRWKSFAVMVNDRPSAFPTSATSLAIDTIAATVHGCA